MLVRMIFGRMSFQNKSKVVSTLRIKRLENSGVFRISHWGKTEGPNIEAEGR